MRKSIWFFILCLLTACVAPDRPPSAAAPTQLSISQPSPQPIPATFTPGAPVNLTTSTPAPTRPAQDTTPPETPIPFDNIVVELRYQIPALGLDRRLEGNVGSEIILIDETAGKGQQRSRQASILLQLQQVLHALELEPLPDGCARCVHLSYSLPYEEQTGEGWLRDPVLLASIENFMSLALGAHFPPGAVAGLRRSASPFAPSQTIALMADGRLWVWQANKEVIPEPLTADPLLFTAVAESLAADTIDSYTATCTSVPVESLFLHDESQEKVISVVCPEYSLPTTLLPLYQQLDAIMAANIVDVLERPPTGFPLDGLIDYQRADGVRLTVHRDGTAVVQLPENSIFTTTLSSNEIISLTQTLIDSGDIHLGLTTFELTGSADATVTPLSRVLVRGSAGMYDGAWESAVDNPVLNMLNTLLLQLIPADTDLVETAVPQSTVMPTPTP
jgi:hypothetical protein